VCACHSVFRSRSREARFVFNCATRLRRGRNIAPCCGSDVCFEPASSGRERANERNSPSLVEEDDEEEELPQRRHSLSSTKTIGYLGANRIDWHDQLDQINIDHTQRYYQMTSEPEGLLNGSIVGLSSLLWTPIVMIADRKNSSRHPSTLSTSTFSRSCRYEYLSDVRYTFLI
jgi:hypothetical protein